MNPTQPTAPQSTGMVNNGAPLSPQQLQAYKSDMQSKGIGSVSQTSSPTASPSSPATLDWVNSLGKGSSNSQNNSGGTQTTNPSFTQNVLNNSQEGVNEIEKGGQEMAQGGLGNDLEGALSGASGALTTALSPVTSALQSASHLPVVSQALGAVKNFIVTPAANAISNLKPLQDFMASHPNADTIASQLINVGTSLGGGEAAPEAAGAVGDAASSATDAVQNAVTTSPEDAAASQAAQENLAQQATQKTAIQDATPAYNKNMIGEPAVKNTDGTMTPRIQSGKGLTGSRTVTTSPAETESGIELSKVKGYDPKSTNLEKFNSVQPELVSRGQALSKSLASENVLRPPKEVASVIKKSINDAADNSLLLSKKDPVIKTYMSTANRIITANDGTLAGELKVRQQLDTAYKNARGGAAFGSDRMSALDEIHTAARNALNDDIASHAQSTDVKASLKADSALYRASEVLRDKAEAEGNSKIDQLSKKFPKTTKAVKTAAHAVGIGAAVHLVE